MRVECLTAGRMRPGSVVAVCGLAAWRCDPCGHATISGLYRIEEHGTHEYGEPTMFVCDLHSTLRRLEGPQYGDEALVDVDTAQLYAQVDPHGYALELELEAFEDASSRLLADVVERDDDYQSYASARGLSHWPPRDPRTLDPALLVGLFPSGDPIDDLEA